MSQNDIKFIIEPCPASFKDIIDRAALNVTVYSEQDPSLANPISKQILFDKNHIPRFEISNDVPIGKPVEYYIVASGMSTLPFKVIFENSTQKPKFGYN